MKTSLRFLASLLGLLIGQVSAAEKDLVPATDIVAKRCLAFATTLRLSHPSVESEEGRACAISRTRYPTNSTIAYGYAVSLWITKKHDAAAINAAKVAAKLGSIDAPVLIGQGYYFGEGVEKDTKEAFRLFIVGLEGGSKRAAFFIADAYQWGNGVGRNAALAWKFANMGAENGDPRALNMVGHLLMEGIGVAKNPKLALEFHLKAAELGDSQAMYNAALCFLEQEMLCGVPKDSATALRLTKKSADWGDPNGMRLLGVMYERGTGVAKNDALAAEWYRKAIAAGDDLAVKSLSALLNPPPVQSVRRSSSQGCDDDCQRHRDWIVQRTQEANQKAYQ